MAVTAKATSRRRKRTGEEIFLSKLEKLAGSGGALINNSMLRDALDWTDERYTEVKKALRKKDLIRVGPGPGGMIGLPLVKHWADSKALNVFISYSHADELITNELLKHLEPLRKLDLIKDWHDRKIEAGSPWASEIATQLAASDIVILIISIDFLNSQYCYETELDVALDRVAKGDAVVIPVIARTCMWKLSKFSGLQALPKNGKAIATYTDQDEALTEVAERIKAVAEARLKLT